MTQQDTNLNTNIIEKIKKLLAMANDARANENEAAVAMQRVQEMLASYNLSMAQVDSFKVKDEKDAREGRQKTTMEKSAMYEYQRTLMRYVADAHYCLYFVGEKNAYNEKSGKYMRRKHHVLVGREGNVITATLMFEYLNSTIEKLAMEVYPHPMNLSKSALSWKGGCSTRLSQRLYEKRIKADQEQEERAHEAAKNSHGTALVLLSEVRDKEHEFNMDFFYGREPGTTVKLIEKWAEQMANYKPEVLSEVEKAKREKRAQKDQERYQNKQNKKWANKDLDAFWAGHFKGDHIGLDDQVSHTAKQGVLK